MHGWAQLLSNQPQQSTRLPAPARPPAAYLQPARSSPALASTPPSGCSAILALCCGAHSEPWAAQPALQPPPISRASARHCAVLGRQLGWPLPLRRTCPATASPAPRACRFRIYFNRLVMPGLTPAQRPPPMKLHSHFRLWSWLTPVFGVSDGALLESAGLDALVGAAAGLQLPGAGSGCCCRVLGTRVPMVFCGGAPSGWGRGHLLPAGCSLWCMESG